MTTEAAVECVAVIAPVCSDDVSLFTVNDRQPRPLCTACVTAAEKLGVPIRKWADRSSPDRRKEGRH